MTSHFFHHAEINFISSPQRSKKNSLNCEMRAGTTNRLNKFSDLIGWNFFYFPLLVKLMLLDLRPITHKSDLSRNFKILTKIRKASRACRHDPTSANGLGTVAENLFIFFLNSKDLVEIPFPRSETHCIKQNLNDSTEKGPFYKKRKQKFEHLCKSRATIIINHTCFPISLAWYGV